MHLDKTPYLNGRPHNCHHCNNSLDSIRNVYRGAGSTRYYDSEKCLIAGERLAAERELMRTARAAGMVHSHWLVGAVALSVGLLAFIFNGGIRSL